MLHQISTLRSRLIMLFQIWLLMEIHPHLSMYQNVSYLICHSDATKWYCEGLLSLESWLLNQQNNLLFEYEHLVTGGHPSNATKETFLDIMWKLMAWHIMLIIGHSSLLAVMLKTLFKRLNQWLEKIYHASSQQSD
jgi:cyanate permease